jgi:hypothetical protein
MTLRYREEESSSAGTVTLVLVGALAGLAVGVFVAQRMGGLNGIRARLRRGATDEEERAGYGRGYDAEVSDYDELDDDEEFGAVEGGDYLEQRVLEAFNNDPVLSERAVDIGSVGEGIIELSGWVNTDDEAHHAVTLARGVPGVDTVVNRLSVGDRERQLEDNARRVADGDPALTDARWEGQGVGTGRRRQGTSQEADRHADPRVGLEDRWLNEREAIKNAADDIDGIAERRRRSGRTDRSGNSAAASTSVPKGDHAGDPLGDTA